MKARCTAGVHSAVEMKDLAGRLRVDTRKVGKMIGDSVESVQENERGPIVAVPLDRWRALPARVRVEDQSTSSPASDAPNPEGGRNPDNDWLLRGV